MEMLFKETFEKSYGDTINVGRMIPKDSEKEAKKSDEGEVVEGEDAGDDDDKEKAAKKAARKELEDKSASMWMGVLDKIDKNIIAPKNAEESKTKGAESWYSPSIRVVLCMCFSLCVCEKYAFRYWT